MSGTLIGSIVVTPKQPRPAESVKVEVLDPAGQSLDGRTDVKVTLNGVPGAFQYLQFAELREHALVAVASAGEVTERETAQFHVAGSSLKFNSTGLATGEEDVPLMRLTQSAINPYVATFSLGGGSRAGALVARPRRPRDLAGRAIAGVSGSLKSGAVAEAYGASASATKLETAAVSVSPLHEALRRVAVEREGLPGGLGIRTTSDRFSEITTFDLRDASVDAALAAVRATMKARYEWTFGDGTTEATTVPYVTHDFFHHTAHVVGPTRFHVSCRIVHGNLEVKRTLNLVSAYGLCKARGTIVPHVIADIYAHKRFSWFQTSLTVYNVEEQPLTLRRQAIVPLTEAGESTDVPATFVELRTPIELPPKSSTVISVSTPIGLACPADAPGFTVYHAGTALDGAPVRMVSIFEVPLNERYSPTTPQRWDGGLVPKTWPWDEVTEALDEVASHPGPGELAPQRTQLDQRTGTLALSWTGVRDVKALRGVRLAIDRVIAARLAPVYKRKLPIESHAPPLHLRADADARKLVGGTATGLAKRASPASSLAGPPAPGKIEAGEICDPDNLTEADLASADSQQLVCQLTDEVDQVMMPGRFMNARKGDVILSPGGTGLIGMLLRSVSPNQLYSHCGIMTRNYDEVTHSTASEEVITDYIGTERPKNGLPENMIKYMWPGVVTQPVEAAINGEDYLHPEIGRAFSISSFSAHAVGVTNNDHFMMVPPLVVKPDPMVETDEVRTKLHHVADSARASGYRPGGTPRSHYRLFSYSDPTIGQTTTAPAHAGWAAGTFPSVCSALIWMSCRERGVRLESDQGVVMPSDLEAKDVAAGAFVNPGTPDGLYTYTASERLAAGQWLYDTIYYMGYDAAGWLSEAMTDAADDLANQLCNTFANDDAKGQDSDAWKYQRDANAISPGNILWWDGPEKGGVYGYAEPLIYREPRKEPFTVSRWKKVLEHGTITGNVTWQGSPAAGVNVRVYEGKSDITKASGKFSLGDVPLGTYNLVAWAVIEGKYCSNIKSVTLDAENLNVNLVLKPPADDYRLVSVYFDFWGEDDETFGASEYCDPVPEFLQFELGPDRLVDSFHRKYSWGGELRAEYTFTIKLLVGNIADVQVDCTLYEGTSETTSDHAGRGSTSFQVGMNQTGAATVNVWNREESSRHDQSTLTVSVKNEQNNN